MLGGGAYVSGKMFFENAWRLHAASMFHERGTIIIPSIDVKLLRMNLPYVTIKNNGMIVVSNIPVTLWIDSADTRIYNQYQTIAGPLNPDDTVNITFSNINIGGPGVIYVITVFTDLPGDSDRTNDTLKQIIYEPGLIWTELTPHPATSYRTGGCGDTIGHFYVYGGYTTTYSNQCTRYDVISGTWTTLSPMLTGVMNVTGAWDPARNRIYVPGGYSPYRDYLQIYDVASDSWYYGANMPMTSSGSPCVVVGDTLWVISSSPNPGILMGYNINTNTWFLGADRPNGRSFSMLVAYDRKLYSVGGWSSDATAYVYDIANDTWAQLPNLPVGRHSAGLEVINDKIACFGGGQSWFPALNSVYILDPNYPEAGWVSENPMVLERIGAATGAVITGGITRLHAACGYSGSANVNEHEAAEFTSTSIQELNPTHITKPLLKVIPTLSKHNVQIKVVTLGSDNGSIKVFDNCGRLIRKLSPILGKGEFTITWNKTDDNGMSVSPGIYFIIFEKRGETLSEKVVIID